jgi:hypothetical protein
MWMTKDTLHVLRGQKGYIRNLWQTEAQTRLWHLNPRLLSRRSPTQECIANTLAQLQLFMERLEALEQEETAPEQ